VRAPTLLVVAALVVGVSGACLQDTLTPPAATPTYTLVIKEVPITVPVPVTVEVPVPMTVEVPFLVEMIREVPRTVEVTVEVPVPVTVEVEKLIEVPVTVGPTPRPPKTSWTVNWLAISTAGDWVGTVFPVDEKANVFDATFRKEWRVDEVILVARATVSASTKTAENPVRYRDVGFEASATIYAPVARLYNFEMEADDFATLYVDDEEVLRLRCSVSCPVRDDKNVGLSEGFHELTLLWKDTGGEAVIEFVADAQLFSWESIRR